MKPLKNPMQNDLVNDPFRQVDGWIDVPTSPGLGVEVKIDTLNKYRFD
jgi:L-alanine-DL-glutamate epimerase-like enolase superfamily enzyme